MSLTKVTSRVLDILTDVPRIQGPLPGIWFDETDGATPKGALMQIDNNMLRIARRAANFGAFEATIVNIHMLAPGNALLINVDGTVSINNGVVGTVSTSAPIAGVIGEIQSSNVFTPGSGITNNVIEAVAQISLTPGDWDVDGVISVLYTSATVTELAGAISTTGSNNFPSSAHTAYSGVNRTTSTFNNSVAIPRVRVSISATTTVYLNVRSLFSAGTASAFGHIYARRCR